MRQGEDFNYGLIGFVVYKLLSSTTHDRLNTYSYGIDFDTELFMPYHLQSLPYVSVSVTHFMIL